MEEYRKKYDRIIKAKPFCALSAVLSVILYIMSIMMARHSEAAAVQYIRNNSFLVMLTAVCGFLYVRLFASNLKSNLDYCSTDPDPFLKDVKYIRFGIILCLICIPVSVVWTITLITHFNG